MGGKNRGHGGTCAEMVAEGRDISNDIGADLGGGEKINRVNERASRTYKSRPPTPSEPKNAVNPSKTAL